MYDRHNREMTKVTQELSEAHEVAKSEAQRHGSLQAQLGALQARRLRAHFKAQGDA
jgi:hypothetical protein